jgi:hypothetical protein
MWQYDLSDSAFTEQTVELDNGLQFNLGETQKLIDEKKEFLAQRRKSMQWIGEPEIEFDEAGQLKAAKKAEKLKAKKGPARKK